MSDFTLPSADEPRADLELSTDDFEIEGSTAEALSDDLVLDGGPSKSPAEPVRLATDDLEIDGLERAREPAPKRAPAPRPAPSPPPPAPRAPAGADAGRHERIARTTREGGFKRLPPFYSTLDADPPEEDWKSILSDDPFERLYLDRAQASAISDGMVKQHKILIVRFWETVAKQFESANASVRKTLRDNYGDLSALHRYATQASADAEALATAEGRTALIERLNEEATAVVRAAVVADFQKYVLSDQTLSPVESEALLTMAVSGGWSREACARFLLDTLGDLGFHTAGGEAPRAADGPLVDVLLSSSWMTGGDDEQPEGNDEWQQILGPGKTEVPKGPQTVGEALSQTLQILKVGGTLSPDHVRQLYDVATDAGFDRDAAADYIAEALGIHRGEWRPPPGVSVAGDVFADVLVSERWLSPEAHDAERLRRHADDRREFEDAARDALRDLVLTTAESSRLLDETRLDREEAAQIVDGMLQQQAFVPARGKRPLGSTASERLTSVVWEVRPPKRTSGLLWVLLALVVAGAAWYFLRTVPPPPETAVVTAQGLNVRSEPSSTGGDATVEGLVPYGTELAVTGYTVTDEGSTWLRVLYQGEEGWVSASSEFVRFDAYEGVAKVRWSDGQAVVISEPEPSGSAEQASEGGDGGFGVTFGRGGSDEPVNTAPDRPPSSGASTGQSQGSASRAPSSSSGAASGASASQGIVARPSQGPAPPPPAASPSLSTTAVYPDADLTAQPSRQSDPRTVQSEPGGFSGRVQLSGVAERDGSLSSLTCASGTPSTACGEAMTAAGRVRYSPATIGTTPVRAAVRLTVSFTAPEPPVAAGPLTNSPNASNSASVRAGQFGLTVQTVRMEASGRGTQVTVSALQTASGFDGQWTRSNTITPQLSAGGRTSTGNASGWGNGQVQGSGSRSGQLVFTLPQAPGAYRGAPATLTFPLDRSTSITVSFPLP